MGRVPGAAPLAISIHAPSQGATLDCFKEDFNSRISIHAPLTGSDEPGASLGGPASDFNPRSPRRERLSERPYPKPQRAFQSTLPSQGATAYQNHLAVPTVISIHAPLAGSDIMLLCCSCLVTDFNPRSPRRERLASTVYMVVKYLFQSTLPSRGATSPDRSRKAVADYFNPRSPRRERQDLVLEESDTPKFQSTLPSQGATCRSRRAFPRI